ncbi:hypothetical protein C8R46DRAFT_1037726 [Mycena filopes]|nr:hypothetical protein C8R46DRAFT_1037726 [Mycena filopes]
MPQATVVSTPLEFPVGSSVFEKLGPPSINETAEFGFQYESGPAGIALSEVFPEIKWQPFYRRENKDADADSEQSTPPAELRKDGAEQGQYLLCVLPSATPSTNWTLSQPRRVQGRQYNENKDRFAWIPALCKLLRLAVRGLASYNFATAVNREEHKVQSTTQPNLNSNQRREAWATRTVAVRVLSGRGEKKDKGTSRLGSPLLRRFPLGMGTVPQTGTAVKFTGRFRHFFNPRRYGAAKTRPSFVNRRDDTKVCLRARNQRRTRSKMSAPEY